MDLTNTFLGSEHPPLLHIGYPKALSSWLQQFLFTKRNGFATFMNPVAAYRQLILPPPLAFDGSNVARQLARRRKRDGPVTGTPVITSEVLAGNIRTGGHDAKLLADRLIACFETGRVLILIREQRSMIRSLYTTMVRLQGYPHTVKQMLHPLDPHHIPQFVPEFLHYDVLVKYYQDHLSADRVLVLPVELFMEDPAHFLRRIADFAGGPATELTAPDRLPINTRFNTGSGLTALYLTRRVNKHLFRTAFNPRGLFRGTRKQRADLTVGLDKVIPERVDQYFERRFSEYVDSTLANEFTASNQRLSELTGLELDKYGYQV